MSLVMGPTVEKFIEEMCQKILLALALYLKEGLSSDKLRDAFGHDMPSQEERINTSLALLQQEHFIISKVDRAEFAWILTKAGKKEAREILKSRRSFTPEKVRQLLEKVKQDLRAQGRRTEELPGLTPEAKYFVCK